MGAKSGEVHDLMLYVTVIGETDEVMGERAYRATWLTTHVSNGTRGYGKNPVAALRSLADELEKRDERQAAINAIDAGDDD
jgi:hypothetical protein